MASAPQNYFPKNQVHLWWGKTEAPLSRVSELWAVLSEAEQARARRFRLERHRHGYIVVHGMLRKILGGYLNIGAREVKFGNGPAGKPAVDGDHNRIRFNLSDSGGHVLYAVAHDREVGVDVETVRPKPKAAALVNRFFSENEKAAFQKIDADEREDAFLRGWTRKEAYVKAIGKGLRFPLDRFDVSFMPEDQNALLFVQGAPGEPKRWSLRDIDLGPDFRGALAVEVKRGYSAEDISIRFKRLGV